MKERLYQNATESGMQLHKQKRKGQNKTFSSEEVGTKNYVPSKKRKYPHANPQREALSLLSDIALSLYSERPHRRLKKRKKIDINDQIQKHDESSDPCSKQEASRRINTTPKDCMSEVKISQDVTSATGCILPSNIPIRQCPNSSSIDEQSPRIPIPPIPNIYSEQTLNHRENNLVDSTHLPGCVQTPPVTPTNTVNSSLPAHIACLTGTSRQNIEDSLKNNYTHQLIYFNLLLQRFTLQPELYLNLGFDVHLQELYRKLTLAPEIYRMHAQPNVQYSTWRQRGTFFSTAISQNLGQGIQTMKEVNNTTSQRFK